MASLFFYEPLNIYFADEGDTLTVGSTDQATAIDVVVEIDGEQAAAFDLDTYNGLAIIPIGEILRTAAKRNQAAPAALAVTASQGEASARVEASCIFCRRYGGGTRAAVFANWLTTGPSYRRTYPDAPEALPFLKDNQAVSQKAMIQMTFEDGSVQNRVFADLKAGSGDGLDVSYSAVRAFARSLALYSPVQSYSLWIEYSDPSGDSTTGDSVRFELVRDRLSRITYKFLGTRGAYEYIHASGELKRSIENETSTFVTSGIETELSNDAVRSMEQNTGHIGSVSEAEFWFAFLSSRERYVLEADGSESMIIISDSKPSLADLQVGELTFTWRYGNKNNTIIKRVSIPVESISITGESVIENDDNQLQLGITYNPAATTQRGVVWELIDGSGYASLSANGLLTIKKGAANAAVTVKAVSSANGEVSATKVFHVTYRVEAASLYGLTVTSNVESPAITLSIDGQVVEYFDGILVAEGASVVITVAKAGYGTQSRTITFGYAAKDQHFILTESVEATISSPERTISSAAQDVAYTISDPSGHGWTLEFSGPQPYGFITGGGVTSGNATARSSYITGKGNAVVYLTVGANTMKSTYTIDEAPFFFSDDATGTRTGLLINQAGTETETVRVTSITLNRSSMSLTAGGSGTLTAAVSPSDATNKTVAWSSSNTSVATVDQDGTVRAVGAGSCSITASSTDGSLKSASCAVTVTATTTLVTGVSLNKGAISLEEGETYPLAASVSPANATDKSVTWRSTDTRVATVSSSGVVTAVAEGTCDIIVTTSDGGHTATCRVEVYPEGGGQSEEGSMSVEDIAIAASATSASGVITCANIQENTITASESASWITGVEIDTSGSVPRVRLEVNKNTLSNSRSAVVTVSALDSSGDSISTTFTITQRGYSNSDVPCTGMTVYGDDTIQNSDNQAEYTASFSPAGTTQAACSWSLTDELGETPSLASMTSNGLNAVVRVLPGAENLILKLRATNSYNTGMYAEKEITVNHVSNTGNINVVPGSVRVNATDTGDETPVVATRHIVAGSLTISGVEGFIRDASMNLNVLMTEFDQNPNQSQRSGSVTLQAIDEEGDIVTAVVQYIQAGMSVSGQSLVPVKLSVRQNGGKVNAVFTVNYTNMETSSHVFYGPGWTLKGYDSGDNETLSRSGSLPDKTVASLKTEAETYSASWSGTLGMTVRYVLEVYSGQLRGSYSGDGNDEIE